MCADMENHKEPFMSEKQQITPPNNLLVVFIVVLILETPKRNGLNAGLHLGEQSITRVDITGFYVPRCQFYNDGNHVDGHQS